MKASRQAGMAVIAALVVVAAVALLATRLFMQQTALVDTFSLSRDKTQAHWLLQGGLGWASAVLQHEAKTQALTLSQGVWAQPIADLPVGPRQNPDSALFSGLIEDEQGKYNLNNLVQGGKIQAQELASLKALLGHIGLPQAWADVFVQRISASNLPAGQGQVKPYLRGMDDMVLLPELGVLRPAEYTTLQRYFTVLPKTTAINVNTAPAEVLAAVIPGLDLAQAQALVAQREKGQWFIHAADVFNRLKLPPATVLSLRRSAPRLDVSSQWFRVSGEVQTSQAQVGTRALLQRDAQGRVTLRWRIFP